MEGLELTLTTSLPLWTNPQCSQLKELIENKTEFVKKALDMLQRPWGRRPVCDRMGANRTAANEDFLILVSGHVPFFTHYRFRRLSSFS